MNKLENYRPCGQIPANPTAKLIYLALRDAVGFSNYVIIPQRRIAEALGLSRKAVSANLRRLEKAGAIAIEPLYNQYLLEPVEEAPPEPIAEKLFEETMPTGGRTDFYLFHLPEGADEAAALSHTTLSLLSEKADSYHLIHKGRIGKKNRELLDLEIAEDEAALVRQIFEKTANEGYGSHRLAEWVNGLGVRTHNGSKWQCNTILRMLKNELYLGYYVASEVRSERISDLQIIDDTLFARTQSILESRNTQWTAKQEQCTAFRLSDYLLSGKLICADCGGRLSTNTNTDRYTKQDGSESIRKTRRYICYHNSRSLTECHGQTSYHAEKVEAAVMEALLDFFSQIQASPQEQLLESKYKQQQKAGRATLKRHEKNLEKLQRELECLKAEVVNALTGSGKFSPELLSGLIAEKETQIRQESAQAQALEAELNDRQTAIKSMSGQFAQFEGWAQEFALCSMERKQTIILHLIDRIEVDRGYVITIHFSTIFEQFFGQASVAA